jgi:hypothetical protein
MANGDATPGYAGTPGTSPGYTEAPVTTGAYRATDDESPTTKRERSLSTIGGLLGLVMFAAGFLRWLSLGEGDEQFKYSGYALSMPTTAVIGLSLAAGLIALLGATETRRGRGVPSAVPTGLAAASLLVGIAIYLGKGGISPDLGDQVGVEPGLIIGIVIALLQTVVLGMALASRHDDSDEGTRTTRR